MRRLPGAELPERMAEVWRWAEELGLRQAAADAADEDDDEGDDAPPPPPPRIERKCLCCGVRFDAPGPYVRMCNGCKKSTAASGMEA